MWQQQKATRFSRGSKCSSNSSRCCNNIISLSAIILANAPNGLILCFLCSFVFHINFTINNAKKLNKRTNCKMNKWNIVIFTKGKNKLIDGNKNDFKLWNWNCRRLDSFVRLLAWMNFRTKPKSTLAKLTTYGWLCVCLCVS